MKKAQDIQGGGQNNYDHRQIEPKWQKEWEKSGIYEARDHEARDGKKKFYGLIEFPYPSGEGLHVGHIRSNTAMDIITRKRRMEGFNVLYPIGWDAFGLPTENYAIKTGTAPQIVTKRNTDTFRRQLKSLGFGFDWSCEIDTTDPAYYRWTQWIFLQMFKRGLAYKKKMAINWCPKDKIGLANEEVIDGCCERCGTPVEKREKEQWMLAITKYADRLDRDLDGVDFLDRIKTQQRNWIGRSEGAEIDFKVEMENSTDKITVFTTRIDTLFGVTYVVLAPDHEMVEKLRPQISNWNEVSKCIAVIKEKTELERTAEGGEKTGVELKGVKVINPANNEAVPVFIADYVLANYGTGAVMAVPAHDERDFAFARKNNLPLREVVEPVITKVSGEDAFRKDAPISERNAVVCVIKHWSEDKYLGVRWKKTNWQGFVIGGIEAGEEAGDAAIRETMEETGYQNIQFMGRLGGTIHARFYQMVKKENRLAHFQPVLLELKDDVRKEVAEEEKALHDLVWLSPKELRDFITHPDMMIVFNRLAKSGCYAGEGLLVNSETFDGMPTEQARAAIAAAVGARVKVNYKLRDWVFSRQRYWGEPIPMVHCDDCKTRKALLIHGFEGKGNNHWFPWLKAELEKRGIEVLTPTLSTRKHPTVDSWMAELMPLVKDFGPNDLVIGHSLGSNAALQLVLHAKKNIGNLFLVASAIGRPRSPEFWKKLREDERLNDPNTDVDSLEKFWKEKIDYQKVAKLASSVTLIRSLDDEVIPKDTHEDLPKEWSIVEWNGYEHFDFDRPLPELMDLIAPKISEGWIPLPESELPLKLPPVENYQPTDTGESPLAQMTKWVATKCPQCGGPARRETDTMPNWAGSSWYYLRYADPHDKHTFAAREKLDYWTPVDWYNGGMEHTTLHLLYSRFWHKFLYDLGLVPTSEPYAKRTSHGLILAADGEKMSKSRGNVINPDGLVETFGADSVRLYEMFMGPFDQAVSWQSDSIVGVRRFLERVWRFQQEHLDGNFTDGEDAALKSSLALTIKKISQEIEEMRFNTCVSSLMIMLNEFEKKDFAPLSYWRDFLKLLAPFAPHIAEELWAQLDTVKSASRQKSAHQSIHLASWPVFDPTAVERGTKKIIIQVNGKMRGTLELDGSADSPNQADLEKRAQALPEIQKWLAGKKVAKIIFVKDRLVNIVAVDQ